MIKREMQKRGFSAAPAFAMPDGLAKAFRLYLMSQVKRETLYSLS